MKKVLMGIIFIIILLVSGFFIFYKTATPTANTPIVIEPTPTPEELATWDDPNGFLFQYPKNLKMNTHDEDTQNYAHIEFTSPDHPGSVIVWGRDTKAASAAAWIKTEKALIGGTTFDTTMAGVSGKKVMMETPKKQIITAVIDDGVVFYVQGNLEDSEYWTTVHATITNTFEFTYNKTVLSEGEDSNSEEFVDEEEMIE